MTKPVIQFGQLEELIAELLDSDQVVRIVILEMNEGVSVQIPDLRQVSVGVHVRTINSIGHILACYLPVATVQLYNGRREGDPTWQKVDAAWLQAMALKERVMAYLQEEAVEKEFTIRSAGVIDLGKIRPLQAIWQSDPDCTKQDN